MAGVGAEEQTSSNLRGGSARAAFGVCVLLFVATFIRYAPSLGFGYVGYDDLIVLGAHPNLYNEHSFWQSLRAIFVDYFPREEPLLLRDVSWALDARLFGFASTFGYHLGNVLLHATNVVLLFLFLRHATRNLGFATFTALLFASLAIHVEPVCWLMGRKDVLAGCFTWLALLVQSIALDQARPRRRWWLAVVFLLYPLAVLAKFSAVTLVLVLAAHRILAPYLDGSRSAAQPLDGKAVARVALGFVPHALVGAALYRWYGRILFEYQVIGGRGPSPLSLQHLKTLALMVPLSLGRTVEHVFDAAGHSISYLRPNVALPLSRADLALAVTVMVATVAVVLYTARRRKDLLFFVVAFFAWLLPYANVEYIGIWVADRYAYLASACIVAVLVKLGLEVVARAQAMARVAALGLGAAAALWAVYGVAAGARHQAAFRDPRSLWTYETGLAEPSLLSYVGLGKAVLTEAERERDATPRAIRLGELRTVVRAGLLRYVALPWRPAPGYFIAARTEVAELYTLLARAAALQGAPAERRVQYLRRSYQIYPTTATALLLAQELFDLALPANESLARESLVFCTAFAERSWPDPAKRAEARAVFANYTRSFPALTGEVEAILARLGN